MRPNTLPSATCAWTYCTPSCEVRTRFTLQAEKVRFRGRFQAGSEFQSSCRRSVSGSRGLGKAGPLPEQKGLSVWPPWKGVIWEERFPWAYGMGCLWVAQSSSVSNGLLAGGDVLGWYPVQSWCSLYLKPQALIRSSIPPPHFLLLSPCLGPTTLASSLFFNSAGSCLLPHL